MHTVSARNEEMRQRPERRKMKVTLVPVRVVLLCWLSFIITILSSNRNTTVYEPYVVLFCVGRTHAKLGRPWIIILEELLANR
jgi:hypothetical protein